MVKSFLLNYLQLSSEKYFAIAKYVARASRETWGESPLLFVAAPFRKTTLFL